MLDRPLGANQPSRLGPDHPRRIVAAAIGILDQGEQLLALLEPSVYTQKIPAAFNGTIGGHYRHCLDHFSSLLRGTHSDLVDYDHRDRDPRIERDLASAQELTRKLRMGLERLDPEILKMPVLARCEVSYEHDDSPVTHSTLGRELVYAIAHGIHHFALISVMARLVEVRLPEQFGVAPSTLAHQRAAEAR